MNARKPPPVQPTSTVERMRHASTVDSGAPETDATIATAACLTIVHHPDLVRVGERALLWPMDVGVAVDVSRLEPDFVGEGATGRPLLDPHLSRRPFSLVREADGSIVLARGAGNEVLVSGEPVSVSRRFSRDLVRDGVLIELADRVLLLLSEVALGERAPSLDLVGSSDALEAVRRGVGRVADLDVPVLLRGETGVGKERVAHAIHACSRRASIPMVAVNMAALNPTTAASELFGHARGAFTDAHQRHVGLFERAHGGTLFLDEIGETPPEIQAMLLRTLETGKVLAVGDRTEKTVDVRLIAATDADLEASTRSGAFRAALLHRLSGFVIHVPPLRQRREDIALLTVAFLANELRAIGEPERLRAPVEPGRTTPGAPWFPASLMARLHRCDWPGNVRQLRNVVRQLVISSRGQPTLREDASVTAIL
ncbi:MAG: sigma-54-dependent Fis family transcriptional regulator, partial [Deltaproteobacteria bacterium]|nr:sigma-54-dependent Fis family transcriptional regulator [Deltaproteobacteria bacterium]